MHESFLFITFLSLNRGNCQKKGYMQDQSPEMRESCDFLKTNKDAE